MTPKILFNFFFGLIQPNIKNTNLYSLVQTKQLKTTLETNFFFVHFLHIIKSTNCFQIIKWF